MIESKPVCMLVGAGRAGTAIARAMYRQGYRFSWIGSSSVSDAAVLADSVSSPAYGSPPAWPEIPDVILITVPDGVIKSVAHSIASSVESLSGKIVLHMSGALGSEILGSLRIKGAAIAAFHPCQTITAESIPDRVFNGVVFDMEGDDAACKVAGTIASDIGGESVRLTPEQRRVVHTALTIGSNYTVILFWISQLLLTTGGIDDDTARNMLIPLFNNTVDNIVSDGPVKALTGPIVRGDHEIVRQHIEMLDTMFPDVGQLYRMLGKKALEMIRSEKTLSSELTEKMSDVLDIN